MGQSSQPHELGGGLKSRHVTMLSIAGVIGASLFVGSSVAIAEAGPAVLLAYLFAGLLVVMIMRMLAEMAVATPDTGSFSTYAGIGSFSRDRKSTRLNSSHSSPSRMPSSA